MITLKNSKCFYCKAKLSFVKFWINGNPVCTYCAEKFWKNMNDEELKAYKRIKEEEGMLLSV